MPRYTRPKKTWSYTVEFKIKAVKLSNHPSIQIQEVAQALDIHPFMLSRWRKEYREGKLQGDNQRRLGVMRQRKAPGPQQMSELHLLRKENEKLKKENDLLKKWQRFLADQHQNDIDSSRNTDSDSE
jgi:transposase